MNAEDWFDDNDIRGKLRELVAKLDAGNTDDTGLEIFLKGLGDIVNTGHSFSDVPPRMIKAILEAEHGENRSVNDMMLNLFNAVTYFSNVEHELLFMKYREGNSIVSVDHQVENSD